MDFSMFQVLNNCKKKQFAKIVDQTIMQLIAAFYDFQNNIRLNISLLEF